MSSYSNEMTKILVVDDEKLILLAMSAMLRRAGYEPVACGSVDEALDLVRDGRKAFGAIITDIMMGSMDGFMFRDVVRGIDPSIPVFFLTALDPEEGGGFLKRILEDPMSFYLPKAVKTEVLLKRIRRIVASRRVELFIERRAEEDRKASELAGKIQRRMLPQRSAARGSSFYTTFWRPVEEVSGDLYDAVPLADGSCLYLVGDIQGHGASAALAMTAVQSFFKQLTSRTGAQPSSPDEMANLLHRFFRANLAGISYMTALICIHDPVRGEVSWISCGAPDLAVFEGGEIVEANPGKKGGVPIGLMPDTVYSGNDVVRTPVSGDAVCLAYTDGIFEMSRDAEGMETMPAGTRDDILREIVSSSRKDGSFMASLAKFMKCCEDLGYSRNNDDTTLLAFGNAVALDGIYEATVSLSPAEIDRASQEMSAWCRNRGWDGTLTGKVQLVFEEKLMNVHDHGFDDYDRIREVASVRLRRNGAFAELTVWDHGTPEPSIKVVAGDSSTVFEKANLAMRSHGRGRLMLREMCHGIRRERYGNMNETVYYVPAEASAGDRHVTEGGGT